LLEALLYKTLARKMLMKLTIGLTMLKEAMLLVFGLHLKIEAFLRQNMLQPGLGRFFNFIMILFWAQVNFSSPWEIA